MKVNTITRTVKVTISHKQLLYLFVNAVYGDAESATGKQHTLYRTLGHLIGIGDVDAVKIANGNAKKEYRITTDEFRKWLPTVFAEFAQAMLEADVKERAAKMLDVPEDAIKVKWTGGCWPARKKQEKGEGAQ